MAFDKSKDLVLDVIGQDHTAAATAAAGKNFERLQKQIDSVNNAGAGFGSKIKSGVEALKGPALAVGGAIVAFGIHAGKAASDAEQSLGATQAIFGKTADAMIKKSNEAADKYGLSADQYRNSADLIGSLFKNQGVASSQLGAKTDDMVRKASDLAAVFGGPTADAVEAFGAAFKGEFDPIERYGISINQTAINAQAMIIAHTATTAAFNKLSIAQQKAFKQQATLALINKQSASTTGQFAAQTTTSAERAQIAQAKYANLSAQLGAQLLPAFNKVLDIGTKIMGWMSKHKTLTTVLIGVLGSLAAAVWLVNLAMAANPVVLIIAGIIALTAAIVYVATKTKFFQTVWSAVWGVLKAIGGWFAGPFTSFFVNGWKIISGAAAAVGRWFAGPFAAFFVAAGRAIAAPFLWLWHNVIDPAWQAIVKIIQFATRIATSLFNLWVFAMRPVGAAVLWLWHNVVEPAWQTIAGVSVWLFNTILKPIFDAWISAVKAVGAIGLWLWDHALKPAWIAIAAAALWLWHKAIEPAFRAVGAVFSWLWVTGNSIFGKVMGIVHKVGSTFKSVFSSIGGFISTAFDTGIGVVKGSINGIIGLVNKAIGGINKIISTANKVPGVDLPHIPTIPKLQYGGPTVRGRTYVVGERGPELWTAQGAGSMTPTNQLGGDTHVHVYIGDEEITEMVRVEVSNQQRATTRRWRSGAGSRGLAVAR